MCLRPSLSGDRVKQRHGNSLSRLLESCYQILDLPEISFLHTRSGLKHERERERERRSRSAENSEHFPISTSKPQWGDEEDGTEPP